MKLNNNNNKIQISFIILLCFTIGKCTAHGHESKETKSSAKAYPPEATQYSDSEQPFPFPPSEAPNQNSAYPPFPASSSDDDSSSSSSSSFSAAFSDILKGTLRPHAITMPEHIKSHKQLALKRFCSHTDYPEICLRTITPFLNHNFEAINVLEAAIMACKHQLKFTIAKVKKHIESSPELASALADCKEHYHNALEHIHKALQACHSHDLGTITVSLSAVMADCSSCESGFEDLKKSSPMARSEGLVTITASNCLAIAHLIPQ